VSVGHICEKTQIADLLKSVGLKPTRQRIAIGWLLFSGNGKHITADMLHAELRSNNQDLALATVYNTLQTFVRVGLLGSVFVDGLNFFDTNPAQHHHFIVDREHRLIDIPSADVAVAALPTAPEGYEVHHVEVLVHLVAKYNRR
jgi:Fur family iron response transcriptional regulator